MKLPDNVDFCYLALTGSRLERQGTHTVLPGLTVGSSPAPIELNGVWERWLGTIQTDRFKKSGLVITAQRQRPDAGASAVARERVERRVTLFHYALMLGGCGYNSSVLMVGGNTANGSLHIGPISVGLTPCQQPQYRTYKLVDSPQLKRAAAMLVSMERVYDHVPGPEYRRVRKGFNSWIRGVGSRDPTEGLHSFVRAAEAIIRPTTATWTKRKITKTFLPEARHSPVGPNKTNVSCGSSMTCAAVSNT